VSTARPLTANQQVFVDELLIDNNATRAYGVAYPDAAAKSRESGGARMLRNAKVAAAIATARKARSKRTEIKADHVLTEIACVAFSDIGDVLDFSGDAMRLRAPSTIPKRARRAIASVKVKRYVEKGTDDEVEVIEFKLWNKTDALRLAAQHLGMLVQKVEMTGKDGQPLIPIETIRAALADAGMKE
jgi:phage terminase small subunit